MAEAVPPCRACRYYPPGVVFVYEKNGQQLQRTLDLLDFGPGSDVEALLSQIAASEPMVTETKKGHLRKLIYKLLEKQQQPPGGSFSLFKVLRAHILPLTNCAFNKSGDRFITGSYDRTCKVWNTFTGEEVATLEGHKNVVYAIAFNRAVCRGRGSQAKLNTDSFWYKFGTNIPIPGEIRAYMGPPPLGSLFRLYYKNS